MLPPHLLELSLGSLFPSQLILHQLQLVVRLVQLCRLAFELGLKLQRARCRARGLRCSWRQRKAAVGGGRSVCMMGFCAGACCSIGSRQTASATAPRASGWADSGLDALVQPRCDSRPVQAHPFHACGGSYAIHPGFAPTTQCELSMPLLACNVTQQCSGLGGPSRGPAFQCECVRMYGTAHAS